MLTKFFMGVFRFYQLGLSPFLGKSCRFYPSCSDYAIQSLEKRGLRAFPSILWRLLRCGPWSRGGVDFPLD